MDELNAYALTKRQICIVYQLPDQNNDFVPPLQRDAFLHPRIQFLSFPDTIIHYSLSASTSKIYQKFIQTCKYFYSKKRVTIIPEIIRYKNYFKGIYKDSTELLQMNSNQLSNIWITMVLESCCDSDQYSLSKFCSKIYKCQARVVVLSMQKLTEEEFRFLVQPDFVITLDMSETKISKNNSNNLMTVEEVFERIPNAEEFEFYDDPFITAQTFSNLAKFPPRNNLKIFEYSCSEENRPYFHSTFNNEMFQTFVTKNAPPNAEFRIWVGHTATAEWLEIEKKKIKKFLKSWRPKKQKPKIFLYGQ